MRLQRKAARLRLEVFERSDFQDILGRAREAAGPGFFLTPHAPVQRRDGTLRRAVAAECGVARVHFMREAPLIVLDEPTASLDPQAVADVFRRFAATAGGSGGPTRGRGRDEGESGGTAERGEGSRPVTAVLVSHRLGSARLCDRVLVLREGRLVEQGSHDELVAAGAEYARMWALQAQWYR